MINCPSCEHPMPQQARKCPHCGIELPGPRRSAAVQGIFCLAVAAALISSSDQWWMYLAAVVAVAFGLYQFYLALKAGGH